MLKFIIQDKGFLITVNKKEIRTPTTILCNDGDGRKISAELIQQGVVDYSIVSNVPNTPEINSKIDINIDKEFLALQNKYILNYVKDNVDERDHRPLKLSKTILREMNTVSLDSDYTSEMSPVKNQGVLGSCVGFAVVSMKEWQEQQEHLDELAEGKKYKRKSKHYDLSEQWLYYKCKEIDYWPGEEGTSIRFAMNILNSVGVPCEKAWPYDDKYEGEPKRWANLVSKWALGGEYLRLSSPEEIIKSLKENGPLPVGVGCFLEIFYTGSDGIVKDPVDPESMYGGHAVCLKHDTKIPLLNGTELTIKEMADKKQTNFWVYSCDKNKNIVPGYAHSVRKTGKKMIYKIELDNQQFIECTLDHKIMMRDGSYKEAQYLKPGDSLMPLYRKLSDDYLKGYEMILNPSTMEWEYTHRISASSNNQLPVWNENGEEIMKSSLNEYKGVVHHKDFNKLNNNPDNFTLMKFKYHTIFHSKLIAKYNKSDLGRKNSSIHLTQQWKDPEFRAMMHEVNVKNGEKTSSKLKKENRLGFQVDPERCKKYGAKTGPINIKSCCNKESIKKRIKTQKTMFDNDIEYREKKIKNAKTNIKKYNDSRKGSIKERIRTLKTTYTRYYKNEYKSFIEFIIQNLDKYEDNETYKKDIIKKVANNHKVVSITKIGYDDVYDLTVDKHHNFAISSGVFVHNCLVGWNSDTRMFKFKNSWGTDWGQNGYGYLSYNYIKDFCWDAWMIKDLSVTKEMLKG